MNPHDSPNGYATDARGVSEVVGVALLLAVVVLGIAAVTLTASPQLDTAREEVEIEQAEGALVEFDAVAARVATGSTARQRIDLGLGVNRGSLAVENDSGHITVEYVDFFDGGNTTEVMNASLGAVVYERGDTSVGYQGGGVWRRDGEGSVMVSPPEMSYRGETLTMPVVRTNGTGIYDEVGITRRGTARRYPDATANLTNRVEGAQVVVTIRSRYYRAWGAFFEAEGGAVVQYDHDAEQVSVTFLGLPTDFSPDSGVIATSGPGRITLEGTGAYVDSYNSSVGPYEDSHTGNGTVKAAGEIVMSGDARIEGDAHSGENVSLGGNSVVDGDVFAAGNVTVGSSATVTGSQQEGTDTVPDMPPINRLVADRTAAIRTTNDNANTSVIQDDELQIAPGQRTLGPGTYYLESLDLQGERLVVDATGGDVTIAVRDYVRLEKAGGQNSEIDVQGDGTVRVFVASEAKGDVSVPGGGQTSIDLDEAHFFVERGGSVDVDDEEAIRFQVFAPDRFVGAIGGSQGQTPQVTATIIAPAGPEGPGEFFVQQGELYGAVMTGNLTVGQYGQVHFDRALQDKRVPLAPHIGRIEYMYLTENRIEVESD